MRQPQRDGISLTRLMRNHRFRTRNRDVFAQVAKAWAGGGSTRIFIGNVAFPLYFFSAIEGKQGIEFKDAHRAHLGRLGRLVGYLILHHIVPGLGYVYRRHLRHRTIFLRTIKIGRDNFVRQITQGRTRLADGGRCGSVFNIGIRRRIA